MQQIRYSKERTGQMAVWMLVAIIFGVTLFTISSGKGAFIGFVFAAIGIFGFPAMVRYAFGDGVVLEYDHTFVTHHGVLRSSRIRWDEVTDIEVESQSVNFIRTNRFLKIKGPFNFLGYAWVTEKLLDKRDRPVEKLADEIIAFLENPAPVTRQAPATGFGQAMPDTRSSGVIGEGPGAPRAGGFGRKGL